MLVHDGGDADESSERAGYESDNEMGGRDDGSVVEDDAEVETERERDRARCSFSLSFSFSAAFLDADANSEVTNESMLLEMLPRRTVGAGAAAVDNSTRKPPPPPPLVL